MLRLQNAGRRFRLASLVTTLLVAGVVAFPGCGGEPEATIIPNEKSRDELQKDLENPYGAPPPKTKGKRSRS